MKSYLNDGIMQKRETVQPEANKINLAELTPVSNRYLSHGAITPLSNLRTPLSESTSITPQQYVVNNYARPNQLPVTKLDHKKTFEELEYQKRKILRLNERNDKTRGATPHEQNKYFIGSMIRKQLNSGNVTKLKTKNQGFTAVDFCKSSDNKGQSSKSIKFIERVETQQLQKEKPNKSIKTDLDHVINWHSQAAAGGKYTEEAGKNDEIEETQAPR